MGGWDTEAGGDAKDEVQPDVLVSFAAPKSCASRFSGRHHFVVGRFVPDDVRRKFGLRGCRESPRVKIEVKHDR